jgi:hypothetical protein
MKKLIVIAALAAAAISTPALADTLTGEIRFGDVRGGTHADSTELDVQYWTTVHGVVVGSELQSKQAADQGAVDSKFSAKAGLAGPDYLGVHTLAYTELGETFKAGNQGEFWGAGVKASRPVYGPVSLNIGYRHREGLKDNDHLGEDRLDAGLGFALTANTGVGATYYRTRGTTNSDVAAISVTHKF